MTRILACGLLLLVVVGCERVVSSTDAGESEPDAGLRDTGAKIDAALVDLGAEDLGPVVYGEMIEIEAGPSFMGCSESRYPNCEQEACCHPMAAPGHEVMIETFFIDKTEVTVSAYLECFQAGQCVFGTGIGCHPGRADDAHLPINCVRRPQAEAFCQWQGKRLCSEAEWEKAARGGCEFYAEGECPAQASIWPWGDEVATCERAVMRDEGQITRACGEFALPVGSKPKGQSPYGVLDMAGSVLEYVADCYHDDLVGAPTDGSAWTTDCNGGGTTKGGWAGSRSGDLATWLRDFDWPGHESCCGIRCCADSN